MTQIYLDSFRLPEVGWEENYLHWDLKMKMSCYGHPYPFRMFSEKGLSEISFAPITVFYGGNGSGKTTLLNVIAQKLEAVRGTYFNRSPFFDDFAKACEPKNEPRGMDGQYTDDHQRRRVRLCSGHTGHERRDRPQA